MSFFSLAITEMARYIQISSSKALHNLSLQGEMVVTLHYKEPRASGPQSFKLKLLVRSDVLALLFTLVNPHAGVSVPAFHSSWTSYPPSFIQHRKHSIKLLLCFCHQWGNHSKIISSSSQKLYFCLCARDI